MRELLPFKLTGAQQRVFGEIAADMAGEQPMHRLVQGDVGSGKTMVAWLASLRSSSKAIKRSGWRPRRFSPSSIFAICRATPRRLGVTAALLTAATPAKERKELLPRIETRRSAVSRRHPRADSGRRACAAHGSGCHRRTASFRRGAASVAAPYWWPASDSLSSTSHEPHMLLMSATPIPRSLAMVLYGDMEVSFVDEMPPGRTPVQTKVFNERERKQVYTMVLDQLNQGHQAFVVLPLVEASEQLQQVQGRHADGGEDAPNGVQRLWHRPGTWSHESGRARPSDARLSRRQVAGFWSRPPSSKSASTLPTPR